MSMQFIDVTARTEEEAVSKALEQLGMDRDEVSVEILERAKSGFLGIGATPAKVRVTYGLEDEKPVREEKPEASAEKKAGKKPERKQEKTQGEKKPRSKSENREAAEAAPETKAPAAATVELGDLCEDEKAKQIRAFLDGLFAHMGCAAQVKVYQPEKGQYRVILEGEKLGQLIGRRGETLDAIQQLTSYSVNRGSDKRVRIHVDAENYRLKREQSLERLAEKVAAKVVKYKRNTTLEPMNAYERHVIHAALQDVPNVTTYSMGTEPNRRIIVAYDKDKK